MLQVMIQIQLHETRVGELKWPQIWKNLCLWHQNHLKSMNESLTLICSFRNTRSKNIKTAEPGSRWCTTKNDFLWRFTYAFHIFRGSHSLQSVTPKQWNHSAGRIYLWCYECYHLYFKPPWINKRQKAHCSSFVLVMEGLYTGWTHIDMMTMTMTFKWFLFYMQCQTECQLDLTWQSSHLSVTTAAGKAGKSWRAWANDTIASDSGVTPKINPWKSQRSHDLSSWRCWFQQVTLSIYKVLWYVIIKCWHWFWKYTLFFYIKKRNGIWLETILLA